MDRRVCQLSTRVLSDEDVKTSDEVCIHWKFQLSQLIRTYKFSWIFGFYISARQYKGRPAADLLSEKDILDTTTAASGHDS